ncbi:unnamed protein product [Phyllotreta striolata]|uniref:NADH dehydrogenase [ubiquinone] 1 beta subcomplex subunit 9 n=1 Tax=Phyllotreta striolata TaxID=444603 RepID=A0A9N9XLH1_PHYSR|nr:unnamed protein product [Phyllotreta striolata]
MLVIVSHTRRVQSLYKRALRNIQACFNGRCLYRYNAVLMRKRFDDNKGIKDMTIANDLIEKGENELFKGMHDAPLKFINSPGGVAYQRVVETPDWVLDYWHPLEKAQYPKYFARREKRKKEYIKMWLNEYGNDSSFEPPK